MTEETPRCNRMNSDGSYVCNRNLNEIGGIGKNTQITKMVGSTTNLEVVGIRELKLWQCPSCKDVKLY